MQPIFNRLCLIGLGLIGSSIARAVKEKHLAGSVVAVDSSANVRERVKTLGIADIVTDDSIAAVRDADCVILCIPVGANLDAAQHFATHMKPGAILSDVGSVKTAVIRDVGQFLPEYVHFVPGHPVAGTEHSGPDAGFAHLFRNRWCILTPPQGTDPVAIELMADFWRALGSNVEVMTPEHHDLVLAITSHVPHLIAYNIVGTAADLETVTQSEVIKFSAGGFRDFTRIAASNPTMWRDVFLHNKEAVLEMLGRFSEDLSALARMIRWGDGDALHALFSRTGSIRRGIVASGQETSAPDFGRLPPKDLSDKP